MFLTAPEIFSLQPTLSRSFTKAMFKTKRTNYSPSPKTLISIILYKRNLPNMQVSNPHRSNWLQYCEILPIFLIQEAGTQTKTQR